MDDTFEAACEDLARGWRKMPAIARASLWLLWALLLLALLLLAGCTGRFLTWALV